jgi:outer membrane receptor protein involved in Fe transport
VNGYYITERQAYRYPATDIADFDPEFIVNTFVEYRYRSWSLGVGVANLLEEERWLAQPYNGGSGPMPLKGREYFARASFKF